MSKRSFKTNNWRLNSKTILEDGSVTTARKERRKALRVANKELKKEIQKRRTA